MATYDDIKLALETSANGLVIGDAFPAGRTTWGSGAAIEWRGEEYDVGKAYASGAVFDTLIRGLADYLDGIYIPSEGDA